MIPTLTPTLQAIFLSFSSCFTAPGLANFSSLVTGIILCQGRHTITRVIQASGDLAGGKHHSAFYDFLSQGRWVVDELGSVLLTLLLPFLDSEVVAPVDDTLCKKGGPHFWGAGMHHDASRSTYGRLTTAGRRVAFAFGHNWVVLAVWVRCPWERDRGLAVPILFRLCRSKKLSSAKEYRKRTELAADMIEIVAAWLPEDRILHVVVDREYASSTVILRLPEGVRLSGSLNMDAALYAEPGEYNGKGRPRIRGKRLPSPAKLAASRAKSSPWKSLTLLLYGKRVKLLVKTRECLWNKISKKGPVRVFVTRDPKGRFEDRAYLCTDPSISAEEFFTAYMKRWTIEAVFRNAKQSMGIGDPQNGWWRGAKPAKKRAGPNAKGDRGKQAVERTLPLFLIAYGITLLWYLRHGKPQEDVALAMAEAPWYAHKRRPSFQDMLAALRQQLWALAPLSRGRSQGTRSESPSGLPRWFLAS